MIAAQEERAALILEKYFGPPALMGASRHPGSLMGKRSPDPSIERLPHREFLWFNRAYGALCHAQITNDGQRIAVSGWDFPSHRDPNIRDLAIEVQLEANPDYETTFPVPNGDPREEQTDPDILAAWRQLRKDLGAFAALVRAHHLYAPLKQLYPEVSFYPSYNRNSLYGCIEGYDFAFLLSDGEAELHIFMPNSILGTSSQYRGTRELWQATQRLPEALNLDTTDTQLTLRLFHDLTGALTSTEWPYEFLIISGTSTYSRQISVNAFSETEARERIAADYPEVQQLECVSFESRTCALPKPSFLL